MPVKIISGSSSIKKAETDIKQLGKKALIVTGGCSAIKSGALHDLLACLEANQIEYQIYNKITQNPSTGSCREAGQLAGNIGADFLIGIGGGSPLDATKAAAIYAANEAMKQEDIYGDLTNLKSPLPTVLLGTTAGTGSEVTGVSVLTNEEGRKKSASGPAFYAKLAICDPKYTYSLPYKETVSTALDAFSHAMESYLSEKSNNLSELYALKAISLVWDGLVALFKKTTPPEEAVREKLFIGSIFAGLAINITGTLFPHTLGYFLTEQKKIPHGRACTAFMPVLLEKYEKYALKKMMLLFGYLNTDKEEMLHIINGLTNVQVKFGSRELRNLAKSRYQMPINAFLRTPGGFTAEDAVQAFLTLT